MHGCAMHALHHSHASYKHIFGKWLLTHIALLVQLYTAIQILLVFAWTRREYYTQFGCMPVGHLTGHINLQYMLHKRRAMTPSCRRCGAEKEMSVCILHGYSVLEKIRIQTLAFAKMDLKPIKEASIKNYVHSMFAPTMIRRMFAVN